MCSALPPPFPLAAPPRLHDRAPKDSHLSTLISSVLHSWIQVQFPAGKMPPHKELTCCRRLRLPQQNKTRAVTLRNQPPSVPGRSKQAPPSARSVHASTYTRNYPFVGRCSCCWPG
ncbi:unnamed protein product [Ectocarpus sp. 8 AP-2014]